ncbi:PGF-CTERM sorting domain-containing protein [Haladaptatus sp. CMAA 1911]|uniref:PGF-CTERM sorting domain-containing protein n=1 Tax=unclassified Haladaptatus TaxID=2622732 RepID=UPI003753FEAB
MVRNVSTYTILALAQVLVLLMAPVAATGPVSGPHSSQQQLSNQVESADSIYVMENGDAVLAYNETNAGNSTAEFGANVTEGLVHILATDETESDMDAAASLVMTPDGYSGNGSLTADSPDSISDLTLDVNSKQDEQTATGDLTLDATLDGESLASSVDSMNTEGHVTVTGDSFSTKGSGTVSGASMSGTDKSLQYDLRETADGFVLKGSQRGAISPFMSDSWRTREKAKAHLEAQYGSIATRNDGSATVVIDSYAYDASGDELTLDIDYHVEFTGLKDSISKTVARSLKSSPQVSLSDEEIDDLSADIERMKIDHVTFGMSQQNGTTTFSWDVKIENYDAAVSAALEIAENTNASGMSGQTLDRTKRMFEAQQAANLEQTVEWSAEASHPAAETTAVSTEVHYRTDNWRAYTRELQNRDVELGRSSVTLHVESDGDEVTARGSVEMKQRAMLSKMTDSMLSSLGSSEANAGGSKLVQAFQSSEFQSARVDMNVQSGTVTVEGGAQFDNMSALADALGESYGDTDVSSIVGRTNGDTTTTYVRVTGLVGENASKADVRALAVADADTNIHMPGEWDREFPSMDTEEAATYLGVQNANDTQSKSTNESGQPGFGVGVAVVALAGAALLSRRD